LHIKSLAGALPIMLGHPQKLTPTDLKKYRGFAAWLQLMDNHYEIMSFRQDLDGFGEPMEGMWDGFQRINTETKAGGIIGVFRHGAVENNRLVIVYYLQPDKKNFVKDMEGKVIAKQTGNSLKIKEFEVMLKNIYDGVLYELSTE